MADRTGTLVSAAILVLAIIGIISVFADPIRGLLFPAVPGESTAAAPVVSPATTPGRP